MNNINLINTYFINDQTNREKLKDFRDFNNRIWKKTSCELFIDKITRNWWRI